MASQFEKFKFRTRYTWKQYTDMLEGLLPEGIIWRLGRLFDSAFIQDVVSGANTWQDIISGINTIQDVIDTSTLGGNLLKRTLSCFASELERIESDATDLLNQTDPGVATDLLEDHERVLGLPESCFADISLTTNERQEIAHEKMFGAFKTTTKSFYEDYAASLGYTIIVEEIPSDTTARIMGVARMGVERMGDRGGFSILQITIVSGTLDNVILKCQFNKLKQAHVVIRWIE